ncbi:DNA repair protein recO [Emticicia oligotrophica DSM 17448]|uniref:DNA repair protein RecO n=1 Tax=Emticicia oligotrophica (strain DSM 17448 / CIP 109782 / MTCC 6937 / GPTSA100-15) TaxID=929562 RepID=A0ABM5N091_EMTOG|nr:MULTISPECIES: DNA repair protein RecO [Emticicia]AFK02765.1 DNA repair protein recO [Emticicia oligotrophica DSM 17448]
MLHKTRGIVISYIRYRETSIIVKIYTEKFGIQSFIENGVRSSKGKNKIALFQPLTLLDMVVYHDEKKDLHRISEAKSGFPFRSLPYDIHKSSIAMFLDEVLNKTLQEHTENDALFDFLYHSLIFLDETDEHFENFHLIFLLKYAFFLGFSPENAQEIVSQFRELNVLIPFENDYQKLMNQLIMADYQTPLFMNRAVRNHLLEIIIAFYKIHVEEFGEIKSLQVLREVLS